MVDGGGTGARTVVAWGIGDGLRKRPTTCYPFRLLSTRSDLLRSQQVLHVDEPKHFLDDVAGMNDLEGRRAIFAVLAPGG